MFIEMMTSNSSSTFATKSSTVRLSHSRSWAKRVASVTATPFLLNGAIRSRTLAKVWLRSAVMVMGRLVSAEADVKQRNGARMRRGSGARRLGNVRIGWEVDLRLTAKLAGFRRCRRDRSLPDWLDLRS